MDDFLASYLAHAPGVEHSLHVLAKGWDSESELTQVSVSAARLGARVTTLEDSGFDFGAYFRIVPGIEEGWICILNTHSRIRAANWLKQLLHSASVPGVGAAGATGSWESQFTNARRALRSCGWRNLPRCLARSAVEARLFPSFPNPHLRTNALLTPRSLFAEFAAARAIPRSKRDAHALESGYRGYSAFLRRRRLGLVVSGADGRSYQPEEWPDSATFRSLLQQNLLVMDNQTLHYQAQTRANRDRLQRAAWGRLIADRGPPTCGVE